MTDEYMFTVPRDEAARLDLLATRPPFWEYLLFGATLHAGLARTETKWRDYSLGYTMDVGPVITKQDLALAFSSRMASGAAIAKNLEKVISARAQEAAFGLPGEPGDPELIEHMGGRVILLYERLLDWASEVRSLRLPEEARKLPELAVPFVAQPIEATRNFVRAFITNIEGAVASQAAEPGQNIEISMELVFTVEDDATKNFLKELKKAVR